MRNYIRYGLTCFIMICVVCGCEPSEQKESQQEQKEAQHEQVEVPLPQPTQLTITFETSSTNGQYSPRNVHAVWVEHADGTFIKTLGLWASKQAKHLTQWAAAAGDIKNEIVSRTGATDRAYGSYTCVWDLKDTEGRIVPDGDYQIRFELTSDNADKDNYHRTTIPFKKKSNALKTTSPVDQGGYTNIILSYEVVPEIVI